MAKKWTETEFKVLKKKYPDEANTDIAKALGRTYKSVCSMAHLLGLKKSEAFFNSKKSGRLNGTTGVATRFTKQMPGWNKGLKQVDYLSKKAIKQIQKTQFKKGSVPHNIVPIGTERTNKEGYTEIKVKNGCGNKNFMFKHRLLFEEKNGPIPEGAIVEFKNGDIQDFSIDNLVLNTRKGNLLANSYSDSAMLKRFFKVKEEDIEKVKEAAQPILQMKRDLLKLNQKITKHER